MIEQEQQERTHQQHMKAMRQTQSAFLLSDCDLKVPSTFKEVLPNSNNLFKKISHGCAQELSWLQSWQPRLAITICIHLLSFHLLSTHLYLLLFMCPPVPFSGPQSCHSASEPGLSSTHSLSSLCLKLETESLMWPNISFSFQLSWVRYLSDIETCPSVVSKFSLLRCLWNALYL